MQTLIIQITSKNGDFYDSLEKIQTQIQSGFNSGFDENKKEKYNFEIK